MRSLVFWCAVGVLLNAPALAVLLPLGLRVWRRDQDQSSLDQSSLVLYQLVQTQAVELEDVRRRLTLARAELGQTMAMVDEFTLAAVDATLRQTPGA